MTIPGLSVRCFRSWSNNVQWNVQIGLSKDKPLIVSCVSGFICKRKFDFSKKFIQQKKKRDLV